MIKRPGILEEQEKKISVFEYLKMTIRDVLPIFLTFSLVTNTKNKINLNDKINSVFSSQKELDIITLSSAGEVYCIDVFLVRDGVNLGNKKFEFKNIEDTSETLLTSFFKQYYFTHIPPDKIVIPYKLEDSSLLTNILSKKYNKTIKLIDEALNNA